MNHSFCADRSHYLQEDPIGTATPIETYILLECPPPWLSVTWDSPHISVALREFIGQLQSQYPQTRCLLIHQEGARSRSQRRLIVYQRQAKRWVSRFNRYEFELNQLDQAIEILRSFMENRFSVGFTTRSTQDLLICTHGSRDQCCARYGTPFYHQARRLVKALGADVQVWRCSHFGGHRFAPTAMTFPDGRVYARLDCSVLESILTRSGPLDVVGPCYRGSTLLSPELQSLERSLWFRFGWDWMKAGFRIGPQETLQVDDLASPSPFLAHLEFKLLGGVPTVCQAHMVPDFERSVTLFPSCHGQTESTYLPYKIHQLSFSSLSVEAFEPYLDLSAM